MRKIETEPKLISVRAIEIYRPEINRNQLPARIADEFFREGGFNLRRDRDPFDGAFHLLMDIVGAKLEVDLGERLPVAAQLHDVPTVRLKVWIAAGHGVHEHRLAGGEIENASIGRVQHGITELI